MSSSLAGAEMMTFLAPASRWPCALARVGEDAGGLDDDVDAQVTPGQRGRAFLDLQRLDLGAADDDRVVALEADVLGVAAQDRVELQQVRQAGVVGEVVDRDDLDVGALALGLLRRQGPVEVASDSAEAVNAYPDGHLFLPFLALMLDGQPSGVTDATRGLVNARPGSGRRTDYPAISAGSAAACRRASSSACATVMRPSSAWSSSATAMRDVLDRDAALHDLDAGDRLDQFGEHRRELHERVAGAGGQVGQRGADGAVVVDADARRPCPRRRGGRRSAGWCCPAGRRWSGPRGRRWT